MYFIQKYKNIVAQNLFIALNANIKDISINIINPKFISIHNELSIPYLSHFFYLYIISFHLPYIIKQYSSKIRKKYNFISKKKTKKFLVYPASNLYNKIFNQLYFEFMPVQLYPEYKSVKLTQNYFKIVIWDTPLTNCTENIAQLQYTVIPNIVISYKFKNFNKIFDEIIFWLIFYEFFQPSNVLNYDIFEILEYKFKE